MRNPMDDPNNATGILDQADEDILTYTVSDETLETAAAIEGEGITIMTYICCVGPESGRPLPSGSP
jgi:hypothetical protein